MFSIASCPKCAAHVTLPAEATAESQVRCPLCHEEYALAEVFAKLPPALVVIDSSLAGAGLAEEFSPDTTHEIASTPWEETVVAQEAGAEEVEDIDLAPATDHAEVATGDELFEPQAELERPADGDEPAEDLDAGFLSAMEPGDSDEAAPAHDDMTMAYTGAPIEEGDTEFDESPFEMPGETLEGESSETAEVEAPAEGEFMQFPETEEDDAGFPRSEFESGEEEETGAEAEYSEEEQGFDFEPGAGAEEAGEFAEAGEEEGLEPGEYSYDPAPDDGEEIPLAEGAEAESLTADAAEEPAATGKSKKGKEKAPKAIKPKKSRSLAGTLVSLLTSAIVGLGGGYLALLWVGGPQRDFLGLGSKLPSMMVPAAFHTAGANPGSPPTAGVALADANAGGAGMNAPAENAPPADEAKPEDAPGDAPMADEKKPAEDGDAQPVDEKKMAADDSAPAEKPDAPAEDKDMPEEKAPAVEGLAGAEKKPAGKAEEEMPAEEKPAADDKPLADDLADDKPAKPAKEMPEEPLAGDEKKPAAEEEMTDPLLAEPQVAMAPLNAAEYTLDDVDGAMKDAQESDEIMSDPSKLSDAELKKARSLYYRRLYKLGEVLTFAKDDDLAPRLADERKAAAKLLKVIMGDEQRLSQVGAAASKWLAYPKRGEHAGILLTGPVAKVGKQGKLFETQVSIPGETDPISVFSTAKPKVAEGDSVIVLGGVIDDPTTNLPGYAGSQAYAVWNGLMAPVPAAAP